MAFDDSILNDLIDKVSELEEAIYPSLQESIGANAKVLETIQTDDQMYKGLNSKGLSIRPFYAASTIRYKKRKGQPFDRVTLRDSGAFHESVTVTANDDNYVISSDVEYAKYLLLEVPPFTKGYKEILGIIEASMSDFMDQYTLPLLGSKWANIITF